MSRDFTISLIIALTIHAPTACHIYCLSHGYDGGLYFKEKSACACFDLSDYEAVISKQYNRAPAKSDKEPAYQVDERKKIQYDSE